MKQQLLIITFLALSMNACMKAPKINLKRDIKHKEDVYLAKGNIYYFGELSKASNSKVIELYSQAKIKPQRLVIFSGGGDVYLGMQLGEFIFDNKLDVEVNKFCFSSCANYIFTAARNKYLHKDSVLGWHGSSWQPSINKDVVNGVDWAVKWRKAELKFFAKIAVDYRITINGFYQYKWRDYIKALLTGTVIMGFNYSLEDMNKFNVSNIFLIDGHWDWKKANKCCHILHVQAQI